MTSELLTGAAIGVSPVILWKVVAWFASRDRARADEDRRDLWAELNKVKNEQADIREKMAALPMESDIQRLDKKIDELTRILLEAMAKR